MGVYIPNMELPPWCGKCNLQDGEICYAINENDIGSCLSLFDLEDLENFCIKRRDDCPLIEIDLVKCGECKYMRKYALRSDEPTGIWCHRWSVPRLVTDDDFCSYGERRADD